MLISLTSVLATLRLIFRSRAALELENLALRHQIGVLQRSARKRPRLTPVDRLLCLAVPHVDRLALGAGPGSTRDGHLPGIVPAFACAGLGRCAAGNRDGRSLPARSEI